MANIFKQGQIRLEPNTPLSPSEITPDINREIPVEPPFIGPPTDGLADVRACLHTKIQSLEALLHSIPHAICDNRQQLSSEIADIVLLITSQLFIHQQHNKEAIVHQIKQIISQLNDKHTLEIALHPCDLLMIQQAEISLNRADGSPLLLKADETLRLGGCKITSEHGVFDAGIERQMDNLKRVLLKMKSKHE